MVLALHKSPNEIHAEKLNKEFGHLHGPNCFRCFHGKKLEQFRVQCTHPLYQAAHAARAVAEANGEEDLGPRYPSIIGVDPQGNEWRVPSIVMSEFGSRFGDIHSFPNKFDPLYLLFCIGYDDQTVEIVQNSDVDKTE